MVLVTDPSSLHQSPTDAVRTSDREESDQNAPLAALLVRLEGITLTIRRHLRITLPIAVPPLASAAGALVLERVLTG